MAYNAFSPVDGKLVRSILRLVRYPGRLTVAFQRGQRMPYMGPFQLFLMINVFFFAVQSAGKVPVFTQPLADRLKDNDMWIPFSRPLTEAYLAKTGQTLAQFMPVFDQAMGVNAKSLIGLMVPPFALLLPLVMWRRPQPLAVNMVFSLHFYAFLLLLLSTPLIVTEISALLGGPGVWSQPVDDALSITWLLSSVVYLYFAIGRVYETRGLTRVFQAAVLGSAVAGIFLVYRFVLLPITLYTM